MNSQLYIKDLNKTYCHKKNTSHALKEINLTIPKHRIVGLIGPNGAGKTTLLKTIAGQLFPTHGKISYTIGEESIYKSSYQVCLVQEYEPLFTLHRIKTILEIARYHYPNWDDSYAERLISIFQLDLSKKYTQLSKGQRGLVGIIIALASQAPITIFDETHISLDVIMRQCFFDLLLEAYTESQRTFILSTHYLNEVSNLFEDIIIMDQGQILLHEEKNALDDMTWTIIGDHEIGYSLLDKSHILNTKTLGKTTEFHYFGLINTTLKSALKNYNFNISRSSLETFFLNIIQKEIYND